MQSPVNVKEPRQPLMVASDGVLYGLNEDGGDSEGGVLYAYDPATNTFSILYEFASAVDGDRPQGELVEVGNKLYGTCFNGGAFDEGVLFSWDLTTSTYTVEHSFDPAVTYEPEPNLTLTSDGTLLGATNDGGDNTVGTIYEFDPSTGTFTSYASFDFFSTGYSTIYQFLEVSPGVFYGMNQNGGGSFDGTLYKFDRSANTITVVHTFVGGNNDGSGGEGQLTLSPDGLIYGTTVSGGPNNSGTIFSYDESTDTYMMLASFASGSIPGFPFGPLYIGDDQKVYGTSTRGGGSNNGNIFAYDIGTGTLGIVADDPILFNEPESGLTYVPDIYLPEAICQDATIDICGTLEGFYTPNDVNGGSRDNSSALFLGLATDSISVATTLSSNTDDYFANGELYYYEQGT
ncbi:MAG: choice-of-anchor tandem repeat GloVer-containing protein, partial [Bacteroidota bacterium]